MSALLPERAMSREEVAEAMGISPASVRTIEARALAKLAVLVEAAGLVPEDLPDRPMTLWEQTLAAAPGRYYAKHPGRGGRPT